MKEIEFFYTTIMYVLILNTARKMTTVPPIELEISLVMWKIPNRSKLQTRSITKINVNYLNRIFFDWNVEFSAAELAKAVHSR